MLYNNFVETKHIMSRTQFPMTENQLVEDLKNQYGPEITSGDIKGYCAMNSYNYQTVTNKLSDYKTGRGKWNLEVTKETVQELEVTMLA